MPSETSLKYRVPAYSGDEPYAFVSYAHEDAEAVFADLAMLTEQRVRVYYDEGIHPGHRWHDELAKAIERCAVFVLFVTARSIASSNCQRELSFALDIDKPVVAVHLEETSLPSGVRLAIGDRQAILRWRFDDVRYRERLIAAIREHLGAASETETAAAAVAVEPAKPRTLVWIALAVLLGGAFVSYEVWRSRQAHDAERSAAIEKVEALVHEDRYGEAFTLARQWVMEDARKEDAALQALWDQIVTPGTPLVADSGVTVSFKAYDDGNGAWITAGVSPIETPLDLPRDIVRLRLEKRGYRTAELVVANPGPSIRTAEVVPFMLVPGVAPLPLVLAEDGKLDDDMVFVPATDMPVFFGGWTPSLQGDHRFEVPAFSISRFEVTNAEFKEFVDAGGYTDPTFWEGLTYRDGSRALTREEARARFVDRTGRPGPADWALSSFGKGDANLPVGGVSWYEAVAYARFRQLSLPTIHHWVRASFGPFEGVFVTAPMVAGASHFLANGPIEAHSPLGLGPWGTFNTAGNVREWLWNAVGEEIAAVGGSWRDYSQTYQLMQAARPMDRLPELGFRLMKSFGPVDPQLLAPITLPFDPEFARRQPVSDDAFEAMRFQYSAATRTPLNVTVERVEESDTWTLDEVVLSFGKNDSFTLYIALPRGTRKKFQPILFGPPGDAFAFARSNRNVVDQLLTADVIVNGGRALIIPIWAGTYQRVPDPTQDTAARAELLRMAPVRWHEDMMTTLAYLGTRADMDLDRVGFVGISSGAWLVAPPILAVDGRVKAAVLMGAGLSMGRIHPMADAVNYAPRIHCPVLMINGRYDNVFPYELSQARLFDLLGSPPDAKKHILHDVGHFAYPRNQTAREVSDWFDAHLGPT